jgi:ketosteroid isomerase-like protein
MHQDYAFICKHEPFAATRELIHRLHRARADHDAFLSFFHKDCRLTIVGQAPDYPFSGIYVGKSGVRALLQRIDGQVELTEGRILNLLVDGDRVALRRSVSVRHRGTAATIRLAVANLIRFRGGKVLSISEYIDTAWLKKLSDEEWRRKARRSGGAPARETAAVSTQARPSHDHPFAATRELVMRAHQQRYDHEAFLGHFHDDCTFRIVGRIRDYPFGGLYVGKAAVGALFRRIDDQIEQRDDRILNLLVDGDKVAIRRSVTIRHYGTSARTRLVVADLFRLRDQKVAEISEYIDTAWLKKLTGDA